MLKLSRVGRPLAACSRIHSNLYVGGVNANPDDYELIVQLTREDVYPDRPGRTVIRFPFPDEDVLPDTRRLRELVNEIVKLSYRKRTLIHCRAGLNRSGLVCALVLVNRGWTPTEAIALLRVRRDPFVLTNRVFEDYVHDAS